MKYWTLPPSHLLTKFMIVPKYIFFCFSMVFFWKLLYFWKQKTRKTYFGGYLEIAYDPTVFAKTPIKVTRTFSLLANGKNITVSHRIFCKIKVDSQIENKLVACMRQVFVWPVDLHTVRFWLISFHLLTISMYLCSKKVMRKKYHKLSCLSYRCLLYIQDIGVVFPD